MKFQLPKIQLGSEQTRRWIVLGVLGMAVLSVLLWAARDVSLREERTRIETSERIRDLSRTANTLFLADESRVDGLMERLRIELRAQGLWTETQLVDALPIASGQRDQIDARRLHAVLRRGLSANEELTAIELVVAGHDGLSAYRLERDAGIEVVPALDPREREGVAKALWYADEIRRSVVSAGRRIERGDLAFEAIADAERPILRVAIGLHDPGELVQGAIVASIDLAVFAKRLEGIASSDAKILMVMPDGREVGSPSLSSDPGEDARNAAFAARVLGSAALPEVFFADGQLIYGLPMAYADGSRANLLVIVESEAPASGLAAWIATPWPIALSVILLASVIAVWGMIRQGSHAGDALGGTSLAESFGMGGAASASELEMTMESFVLRDWLGDVRGCLERDAATRGLAIDLRCDRSLPNELNSDPSWLGGLLVAMGREALDATSEERIHFEVLEDVGNTLRFELVASGVILGPVYGMEEVAGKIGGHFETASSGRVALVMENVLAAS